MKFIHLLIAMAILLCIGNSAQATTVSGTSNRELIGECDSFVDITFISDDPTCRLTKAVIDISSVGVFDGMGVCLPPTGPMSASYSGWNTGVLTIDFTGFEPSEIFLINLDDDNLAGTGGNSGFQWNGPTITLTFVCSGQEFTCMGTYSGVGPTLSTATFECTCNVQIPENIVLDPPSSTNELDTTHTVTTTVTDACGYPVIGHEVTIEVVSGPNVGTYITGLTDTNGQLQLSYTGNKLGTDVIEASCLDSQGVPMISTQVTKTWVCKTEVPEFPTIALPIVAIIGFAFIFRKRE